MKNIFICLSVVLFLFKTNHVNAQARVNAPKPSIEFSVPVSGFSSWYFDKKAGEWKGNENNIGSSNLGFYEDGLMLSKVNLDSDSYYILSWKKLSGSVTGAIFNDYSFVDLYGDEKTKLICYSDMETSYGSQSLDDKLIERFQETLVSSKYEEKHFCDKYFPFYESDEGPIRFRVAGNNAGKNMDLLEKTFSDGPYTEITLTDFRNTFLRESISQEDVQAISKKAPVVEELTTSTVIYNYSESSEKRSTSEPQQSGSRFSGDGVKKTRTFSVDAPWRLSWTNEGGYIGAYLHKSNGEYVDLLINSTGKSGSSTIYESGTFYFDVNAIGKWTITVRE